MSFNVAAIPQATFIGAPVPFPTKLGTLLKYQPRVWSLSFNWSLYGVSNSNNQIAVPINLAVNNQSQQLDAIRGCYIDNTGSDAAVYVYFPDTGCLITCAQFSTNWQPVMTNLLQCVIIGKGFVTGDTSQTTIFLTNETLPPGESAELSLVYPQYLASPRISRGNNQYSTGFVVPAVGDQWQYINAVAGTNTTVLFGSPYTAGGYITLTNWHVDGLTAGTFSIASTGPSGTFFTGGNAVTMDSLQVKLNAAETWQFKAIATTGVMNAIFCYSYQGSGLAEILFSIGNLNAAVSTSFSLPASDFMGVQFTAPQTGSILSIQVSLPLNGGNPFAVSLYSDNSGHPGTLVGTSAILSPVAAGTYQFNFSTPLPQITSGSNYWVVIPASAITHTINANITTAVTAGVNGSGSATTIAGVGIASGGISAGQNIIFQVNCEQP